MHPQKSERPAMGAADDNADGMVGLKFPETSKVMSLSSVATRDDSHTGLNHDLSNLMNIDPNSSLFPFGSLEPEKPISPLGNMKLFEDIDMSNSNDNFIVDDFLLSTSPPAETLSRLEDSTTNDESALSESDSNAFDVFKSPSQDYKDNKDSLVLQKKNSLYSKDSKKVESRRNSLRNKDNSSNKKSDERNKQTSKSNETKDKSKSKNTRIEAANSASVKVNTTSNGHPFKTKAELKMVVCAEENTKSKNTNSFKIRRESRSRKSSKSDKKEKEPKLTNNHNSNNNNNKPSQANKELSSFSSNKVSKSVKIEQPSLVEIDKPPPTNTNNNIANGMKEIFSGLPAEPPKSLFDEDEDKFGDMVNVHTTTNIATSADSILGDIGKLINDTADEDINPVLNLERFIGDEDLFNQGLSSIPSIISPLDSPDPTRFGLSSLLPSTPISSSSVVLTKSPPTTTATSDLSTLTISTSVATTSSSSSSLVDQKPIVVVSSLSSSQQSHVALSSCNSLIITAPLDVKPLSLPPLQQKPLVDEKPSVDSVDVPSSTTIGTTSVNKAVVATTEAPVPQAIPLQEPPLQQTLDTTSFKQAQITSTTPSTVSAILTRTTSIDAPPFAHITHMMPNERLLPPYTTSGGVTHTAANNQRPPSQFHQFLSEQQHRQQTSLQNHQPQHQRFQLQQQQQTLQHQLPMNFVNSNSGHLVVSSKSLEFQHQHVSSNLPPPYSQPTVNFHHHQPPLAMNFQAHNHYQQQQQHQLHPLSFNDKRSVQFPANPILQPSPQQQQPESNLPDSNKQSYSNSLQYQNVSPLNFNSYTQSPQPPNFAQNNNTFELNFNNTQPSTIISPSQTHHITFESTRTNSILSKQMTSTAVSSFINQKPPALVSTNASVIPNMSYVSPKVEDMDISSDDHNTPAKIEIRPGAQVLQPGPTTQDNIMFKHTVSETPTSLSSYPIAVNGVQSYQQAKSVISFPHAHVSLVNNQPSTLLHSQPGVSVSSSATQQQQSMQYSQAQPLQSLPLQQQPIRQSQSIIQQSQTYQVNSVSQQPQQHSQQPTLQHPHTSKVSTVNQHLPLHHVSSHLPLNVPSVHQLQQHSLQISSQPTMAAREVNETRPINKAANTADDVSLTRAKEQKVKEVKKEPTEQIHPIELEKTAPVISIPESTKDIKAEETVSPGNCFDILKKLENETTGTKPLLLNNNNDSATTPTSTVTSESVSKPEPPVKEEKTDRLIIRIPLNLVKLKGKKSVSDGSPPTAEDLEIDILGDDSPLKRKAPHCGHSNSSSSARKLARISSSDNETDAESEQEDDGQQKKENDTATGKKSLVVRINLAKLSRLPKVCLYNEYYN